jgi:hypothetical protein
MNPDLQAACEIADANDGQARLKPGSPAPLQLWWHGDSDSNDQAFLVEGLLREIGTAIMPGPWGSYKTFVAIDLAVSVMRRNTFAGRAINKRCGVLFIAAEGAFEIPIRLQAAYVEESPDDDSPLPFARADQCVRLLDKSALAILKATADEAARHMKERHGVELGLIEIDTMAAAAGFDDENSNSETQRAMNVLKALADHAKCCVLVVDHFGKSAETGTRGGSAKEASADAVLAILKGLGVRAGASELIAVDACRIFALELKAEDGRRTEARLQFMADMEAAGAFTCVAYGLGRALAVLASWGLLPGRAS